MSTTPWRRGFPDTKRPAAMGGRRPLCLMTLLDWAILLVVAGICGAAGQAIGGTTRGGCLAAIALGFIGALLGMWISRLAGLQELFALRIGDQTFPVIWSIIGSALFVAAINFVRRSRL